MTDSTVEFQNNTVYHIRTISAYLLDLSLWVGKSLLKCALYNRFVKALCLAFSRLSLTVHSKPKFQSCIIDEIFTLSISLSLTLPPTRTSLSYSRPHTLTWIKTHSIIMLTLVVDLLVLDSSRSCITAELYISNN